jgi:hypothetical protein
MATRIFEGASILEMVGPPERPVESKMKSQALLYRLLSPLAKSRRPYPQNSLNCIELYLNANAKAIPERENNNGKGTIETRVRVRLT